MPVLTFVGGAGTVTGSCHWIRNGEAQILVDCGLFQGPKSLKELNYRPFPFDPKEIDALLLTHAHIDHSGLVPKLCRQGFRGRIVASGATCDLLTYMLPDSGYIQEIEVKRLNERRVRRGEPSVEPIYTRKDAERALKRLTPAPLGAWIAVAPGMRARLWDAGHLLGSCSIELEISGPGEKPVSVLFSGDVGTGEKSFHSAPVGPAGIDYVVVESTYGDRVRPPLNPEGRRKALAREVRQALAAGGNLLIPVFAVERTQELLFDLRILLDRGALPHVPVFLDSPLAARATEVFSRHVADLGEAAAIPDAFRRPNFHLVETAMQSSHIDRIRGGAIIMAASGMCEAGRIRHHLLANLWRTDATVLFVGYQAPGTLGRLLLDGERAVRIMGQEIKVNARIRQLDIYSAHADQRQLVGWVVQRMPIHRALILTHGEAGALTELRNAVHNGARFDGPILEPRIGMCLELSHRGQPRLAMSGAVPAPPDALTTDWHNDYASLVLALGERVRRAPNDRIRKKMLARMRRALGNREALRRDAGR